MNNEQQNRYFRHFKGGLYKLHSELPICSHLKKKLEGEYAAIMSVVEADVELSYKPVGRALGIFYGKKRVLTLYGKKGIVALPGLEEIDPCDHPAEYFDKVKTGTR